MRITGIIAEYNPFHMGHLHHLQEAKRLTRSDAVVVVMSGFFVQRGEPAVVDKYRRAKMALLGGADAVLELPVAYATASGESFASAAVEILDSLGVVTDLVYGCESGTPEDFAAAAALLSEESPSFKEILKSELRRGRTFPEARSAALSSCLPGSRELLSTPNNILAVEYHKALLRRRSSLRPHAIPRLGSGYHSPEIPAGSPASASAIRSALFSLSRELSPAGTLHLSAAELKASRPDHPLWNQLPDFCVPELDYQVCADDLSPLLHYALQSLTEEELADIQDMNPELASRLSRLSRELLPFTALAGRLKTRPITRTRVNRALLHTVLGLHGAPAPLAAVRILGLRRGCPVLRQMQDASSLPLVTKLADVPADDFTADLRASEIYRTLVWQKTGLILPDEYRTHPVLL